MKGILKLFPAALAVFALASCSNDDLFGSINDESNKLQLIATVEAPGTSDNDVTRAAFVPNTMTAIWQNEDKFRVYDAALQKYDEFVCNGTAIQLDGDPAVDAHAKAIFPGDQVYYAGYDKANNDVIAIMEVPSTINYGGQVTKSDGTVAYVSALPMWGDVTDATSTDLKVDLKQLGAYTDIIVYQKSVKYIRVLAANTGVTDATTVTTNPLSAATNAEILASTVLDKTTPLAGYFEAQLKTGGVLKANTANPVIKDSYKSLIYVDLSSNQADEAHIYIPIIAGVKYKNLIIQTSANGTAWSTLKAYPADAKFDRNGVLRKDLVCGDAPITAHAESLKDLNRKLAIIASTAEYAGKTVNIYVDGTIKTGEDQGDSGAGADPASDGKTLIIPDMSANDKDLTVNIIAGTGDGIFHNTYTNTPLTIKDATTITTPATHAGHTATINFKGGLIGTESVIINTTAGLKLGGTITSSNNADGYSHKTIDVQAANGLTLGLGIDGDFNTDMNVKVAASLPVTVDANGGTIAAIDASAAANTNVINVKSGTVTAIGGTTAAATPVTVDGTGKVTTLKTNAGNVKIEKGGNVTTTDVKGAATVTVGTTTPTDEAATATTIKAATGKVTINSNAVVTDVTTGNAQAEIYAPITSLTSAATGSTNTITATANIGTLKLAGAAPEVTLNGTTAATDAVVKIENLQTTDANTKQTVTLSSKDRAAVVNVTFARTTSGSADAITATSSITTTNAADVKTDVINSNGDIYTAAQLAGVTTGKAYNLRTNITATGKWTPLNISGNFTTYGNSISALDAPLFNKISGTATVGGANATNKLTLAGVTYTGASDEDNLGAIAKEVDGTVTLKNITVTSATLTGDATSENVGSAIGKANGTVTLTNVIFTASSLTGHANVGGFIGNFAAGTLKMTTNTASAITLNTPAGTYTTTDDDLAGTFGNIIGSVTGTANITIGASGDALATFATGTLISKTNYKTTFNYNKNVDAEGGKFSGMYGISVYTAQTMTYEIGYTPGTATVTMYGVTKDALGNAVSIGNNDINQFKD